MDYNRIKTGAIIHGDASDISKTTDASSTTFLRNLDHFSKSTFFKLRRKARCLIELALFVSVLDPYIKINPIIICAIQKHFMLRANRIYLLNVQQAVG